MRRLLFLAAILQTVVHAEDTHISAEIQFNSFRTRPQPEQRHSSAKIELVLHSDGTVDDSFSSRGRHEQTGASTSSLGERYHVIDERTIERRIVYKDRVQTLTIALSGRNCNATMTNELNPGFTEFESFSTQLGQKAFFKDWKMTSSTCSIR